MCRFGSTIMCVLRCLLRLQTQNVLLDDGCSQPDWSDSEQWSNVNARLADFGIADVLETSSTSLQVPLALTRLCLSGALLCAGRPQGTADDLRNGNRLEGLLNSHTLHHGFCCSCEPERDDFASAVLRSRAASSHQPPRMQRPAGNTFKYAAPELLQRRTGSPASDVWALGCVVWELLTGEVPWGNCPRADDVHFQVYYLRHVPDRERIWSAGKVPHDQLAQLGDVVDAVYQCFAWEPAQRPHAAAIRQVLERAMKRMQPQ